MLTGRIRRKLAERRCIASIEFAMAAPIMLTLTLSGVDAARAYLIWAQIHNAANAIVEAAEKMSVTTNQTTGAITTQLTADQMQQAMSVVYAEIPQLNLANAGGLFPDSIAVVLSSITWSPLCKAATNCGTQTASVVWSTYLQAGGTNLYQGFERPCGTLQSVARFPDNNGNINKMVNTTLAGGTAITQAPQLVADIAYSYHPFFPWFIGSTQFVASATMPAPVGGLTQVVTLNTTASTWSVESCS
jgi:Flp pilus assembly protein TadG